MRHIVALFWNRSEGRLRAGWRLLGGLLLVLIVTLLTNAIMGMLAFYTMEFSGTSLQELDPQTATELVQGSGLRFVVPLATLLGILGGTWVAGRFLDRRPFRDFGFRLNRNWWADLAFGLALGAGLMAAIFFVEWATGWITIRNTFQTAGAGQTFVSGLVGLLLLYLSVGIYEELISRGFLLQNLAEGFEFLGARSGLILAWFLSSSVFGLLHAGNPNATLTSTVSLMLAGLFLGLGFVLTGELAIPIGVHITWNFFQGPVFGFPVSGGAPSTSLIAIEQGGPDVWTGGAFGPEAGLLGITAILVGSVLILAWVRWRYADASFDVSVARPPVERASARTEEGDRNAR